jgi:hypothetical protein
MNKRLFTFELGRVYSSEGHVRIASSFGCEEQAKQRREALSLKASK